MNVLINRRNNRRHAINREHPDRKIEVCPVSLKLLLRIESREVKIISMHQPVSPHIIKLFFIIRKVSPLNLEKYYEIMKQGWNATGNFCV